MDWKEIVRTVAPAIGLALGGPLVGSAVKILGGVLLGDPDATEADVAAAVKGMTPDHILAIKKADQEFALKMEEAGIKLEEIASADRDSARKREVGAGRLGTQGVHVLASLIIATFGYVVYWVLNPNAVLPDDPNKVLMIGTVIGLVSSKADVVCTYFFGSTATAKRNANSAADALVSTKKGNT